MRSVARRAEDPAPPSVTRSSPLDVLGFSYTRDRGWRPPIPREASDHDTAQSNFAEAMHAALVRGADALDGQPGAIGRGGGARAIADTIEAYEAVRWPFSKMKGVKG